MDQRFEYKFVRLDQFRPGPEWFGFPPIATRKAMREYPEVVHAHAREGWRLVQIFTPGTNMLGPGFIELIFERPVDGHECANQSIQSTLQADQQ
jgi:hypothetical protein